MKNGLAKTRWPDFPGWDERVEAIETLGQAREAYVDCSQKYRYLNIVLQKRGASPEPMKALCEMADMIEKQTDFGG